MKVFVYGTLKPDESNYPAYCHGKVISAVGARTRGILYHLASQGYPAMTVGDGWVEGVLLTFRDDRALEELDRLEDYEEGRSPDENEYQRLLIPVHELSGELIGEAWGYFMNFEKIKAYKGVLIPGGHWTGQNWL